MRKREKGDADTRGECGRDEDDGGRGKECGGVVGFGYTVGLVESKQKNNTLDTFSERTYRVFS